MKQLIKPAPNLEEVQQQEQYLASCNEVYPCVDYRQCDTKSAMADEDSEDILF